MRFENNSHDAFLTIAEQAGIRAVDLLPGFRTLAREGTVLYYPFDTHWNPLGRRTAAEMLAASLREVRDAKNNEAHGAMNKEHHGCARRRVGEPAVSCERPVSSVRARRRVGEPAVSW